MMMIQWTIDRTGNSQNVAHTLLLSAFRDNNIISSRKVPWNGAISISGAISIIYKFYNCNCSKNKNYKIKSPLSL